MSKRCIHIGFAIDMDGAYNDVINAHGSVVSKDHVDYQKYKDSKEIFLSGMDYLFTKFKNENIEHSVTWFVNEAGFNTTDFYPDIIEKCAATGELGLHTHFDGKLLGGEGYKISDNKKDWFQLGLVEPTNKLQNVYLKHGKKINAFKAGCHLRTDDMFDAIGEIGYTYDTTMVYEDTVVKNELVMFDDTQLMCGTLPFFITTSNGYRILEIPEIRTDLDKIKKHISLTPIDAPVFLRFQIHPWDVKNDRFMSSLNKAIEYCKREHYVTFANIEKMGDIYVDYLINNFGTTLLSKYNNFFTEDQYYKIRYDRYKSGKTSNFWETSEIYLLQYMFKTYNNAKLLITDCFAGIGQIGMALSILGFKNIQVIEYDEKRSQIGHAISIFENLKNINFIRDDFFKNQEILQSNVFISLNSVADMLSANCKEQHNIYTAILENNGDILMDILRYGSDPENGEKIVSEIMTNNEYNKIELENNLICLSKNKIAPITKYSEFFTKIEMINGNNITINTFNDNMYDLLSICVTFTDDTISTSAGIYFRFPISYLRMHDFKMPVKVYKLSFYAKSENTSDTFKLKVYTGIKYIILDQIVTNKYELFSVTDIFDFTKPSTYRIGFISPTKGGRVYINNPQISRSLETP